MIIKFANYDQKVNSKILSNCETCIPRNQCSKFIAYTYNIFFIIFFDMRMRAKFLRHNCWRNGWRLHDFQKTWQECKLRFLPFAAYYMSLRIFYASRNLQQRERHWRSRPCRNYKGRGVTEGYIVASLQRQRKKFLKSKRRRWAYNMSSSRARVVATNDGWSKSWEKKETEERSAKVKESGTKETGRQRARALCTNDNVGCRWCW